jgi:hypothetical protein
MRYWRLPKKAWVLLGLIMILVAGHALVLYRVFSRMTLAVALGLLLLVLLKQVGVFGPIYALTKRRARH